jgi:hypothetical protein
MTLGVREKCSKHMFDMPLHRVLDSLVIKHLSERLLKWNLAPERYLVWSNRSNALCSFGAPAESFVFR